MEAIRIQISPKQMSKLRNGKKVRVKKPEMEGGGITLLVEPSNYSSMTRTFSRNKGMELALSPSEIMANKEQAPSMQGQGIFGTKFDKKVEETIGKKGKKKVYGFAKDVLNPIAKTALYAGIATGATALSALQPELVPLIVPAAAGTADFLGDYLDKPSDFYSKPNKKKSLAKKYLEQQALGQINSQLGTNMGYMTQAGLANAAQDKASQVLNASAIEARRMLISRINSGLENVSTLSEDEKALLKGTQYEFLIKGSGLYPMAGSGLYPASGNGLYLGRQGGAIVGRNGGFVDKIPQAIQSQPLSSNYQFRYTLPVMLQKMVRK
jgi:hypothetical protein